MSEIKLHIGGQQPKDGWSILNIQAGPGVDYVGNCTDLSSVADGSCAEVYASHVLEHLSYDVDLPKAMGEFHRVLKPGGRLRVSVPDLEVLSRLFARPDMSFKDRYWIMRMMFGGQTDRYDFHCAGLWPQFLTALLKEAGFTRIVPAATFGEFEDASETRYAGELISLNVEAYK